MKNLRLIFFTIIFVLADQVTKYFMTNRSFSFVDKVLGLKYTLNYGAAFGILQGYKWFLIIAAAVIIVFLLLQYPKEKNYMRSISYILIISGALGNLIDRIYFGYVRDFISVWIWPNFNLADLFVSLGVIGLMISMLRKD